MKLRHLILGLALAAANSPAGAEPPARPLRLELHPARFSFTGPEEECPAHVTAVYANGDRRDVTAAARFSASGSVALEPGARVRAVRSGEGAVTVALLGLRRSVPARVHSEQARALSFRYDVLPVLSRSGCNQGACHGNSEGRGGLKLSLKGEDPAADYSALAIHGGRRLSRTEPGRSLLLLKATSSVPHAGGMRFRPGSPEYALITGWIAQGARPDDDASPRLVSLTVTPLENILYSPARFGRLEVQARFSDGTERAVAHLAGYNCEEPAFEVSPDGGVTASAGGDAGILVRYADGMTVSRFTVVPRRPVAAVILPGGNLIDELQVKRLARLGLTPSADCTDAEFLRRVYLDAVGTLPSPVEAEAFLADARPDRRARLIDALLQRPEFDDYWTMKWADLLRVEERSLDPTGAPAYRGWIRAQIAASRPMDQFARELLLATGSTYASPPANYYRRTRTPADLAETTAQVFLGTRLLCAKCHDHPTEQWKQDDYYGLAAFFAGVTRKGELTRKDRFDLNELIGEETIGWGGPGTVEHPRTGARVPPRLPGGLAADLSQSDTRVALAGWLAGRDNPLFMKAMVNRVWHHLFGRGLVDPVDDLRASNPASNPELLDRLVAEFARLNCDLRGLIRLILNSRTYQLSSEPNATNSGDDRFFSRAIVRRLPAEVLLDAISQVTEVPEAFNGFPAGTRAIHVYPLNKRPHRFLKLFGQPQRESVCECDRADEPSLGQSLALIGGEAINGRLSAAGNRLSRLLSAGAKDAAIAREFYLAALSRPPTPGEAERLLAHVTTAPDRRAAWEDILWGLLNSKEFLLRR